MGLPVLTLSPAVHILLIVTESKQWKPPYLGCAVLPKAAETIAVLFSAARASEEQDPFVDVRGAPKEQEPASSSWPPGHITSNKKLLGTRASLVVR